MTKTALRHLQDAFTRAQNMAITAFADFRLAQEAYDAKRRAGEKCSLEYAIYCDAHRWEQSISKYASDCLMAVEAASRLPIEEE